MFSKKFTFVSRNYANIRNIYLLYSKRASLQFNSISSIMAKWSIQEHERQMNRQKTADRKNSTTQKY